jgi:hypothetical protein
VNEQPTVPVTSWRIFQAGNGHQHLLALLSHGPLRITSPIVRFDAMAAEVTTSSGRTYGLLAPPEGRQIQRTLLAANAVRAGLIDAVDVSEALWQLVLKQ